VVGIVMIFLFIGLLMSALITARSSSPIARARNDLRNLGLALEMAKTEKGTPKALPSGGEAPRLREWFPETLLWRPELITDDAGRATLDVDLADSITTWRLAASAVSADGKLGGATADIRVFQPFFVDVNLPVSLTRGDEVTVPVVVYNYLDRPQTVELSLADAPWLERLGDRVQKLDLKAGEVRSVGYRLRVRQVGHHALTIAARGGGVSDAVRREVEVLPDGRAVESVQSGSLVRPAQVDWAVPAEAIPGCVRATVRVYPSTFSQVVEGLDAIFQLPYGCFEQTSSTTYPNVLALDYLRRVHKTAPAVEAKARQYIHLGYQRLLSFEISGGGFDWFGRPPANRTLSAYGLMEFNDMARVHDVDPQLLDRTRRWLLDQRHADGAWEPEGQRMHDDPTGADAQLSTTAYIAWAVFAGRAGDADAGPTRHWLLNHADPSVQSPYELALLCNALVALEADSEARVARHDTYRACLDRLESLRRTSPDGKLTWWEPSAGRRTMFYGDGRSASIETTALAALALMDAGDRPETVRQALAWLITQKDERGTWYSTQATVWTLRALVKSAGKVLAENQPRRIEIRLDDKLVRALDIPAEQADVVQQIDLTGLAAALAGPSHGAGKHRLAIVEPSGTAANYQALLGYHVPGAELTADHEPLSIRLAYDKTTLNVNDTVTVTATIVNHSGEPAPMVILDLPIPPGFVVASHAGFAEADDLARLVASGAIAKYQLTPRRAIVYLRQLPSDQPLELRYRLRATMPVRVTAPPARAYEYYNPDRRSASAAATLVVKAG